MIIAYVGAAATKSIILGLIILGTSAFFVPVHIAHPLWMVAFLLLTATTFSLFGFVIGIWAKGFEQLQLIPMLIVTPLTFLGGAFYSIDMLPPGWRTVALFNPVVYLISGFRWSFYGTADVAVGISLAMTLAFLGRAAGDRRLDVQDRLPAQELKGAPPRRSPAARGASRVVPSRCVAAAGGLHGGEELQLRVVRDRRSERPVVLEQDERTPLGVGDAGRPRPCSNSRARTARPPPSARTCRAAVELDRDLVLGLEPVLDDLELQHADGAEDRVAFQPVAVEEELHRSLLRELLEPLLELLAFQRILERHLHEMLGREPRARPRTRTTRRSASVSPMRRLPAVPHAQDVAGEGLVDRDPLLREELHVRLMVSGRAGAHMVDLHARARTGPSRRARRRRGRGGADPCSPGS